MSMSDVTPRGYNMKVVEYNTEEVNSGDLLVCCQSLSI